MNQYSSIIKKYYLALIGASLISASLFHFAQPVFSAGTEAGQKIRNTATGTYKDDNNNSYTIDSNTVEVTVAKVAGVTNIPSGITDKTTSATNTSVLTGDDVSFEFTITNVGNHRSDIYIPGTAANLKTKGLDTSNLIVEVSQVNPGSSPIFVPYSTLASGIIPDVPANGQIIVKVTGKVTATAAGAPIEVLLGDTGSNTDPNTPVADTQNQFDSGTNPDAPKAANEVRTLNPTTPIPNVATLLDTEQKEASSLQQVFLGANPVAMTRIEKTRGTITGTALNAQIIPYNLSLEVLTTTPNSLFTPGKLKGRDFTKRMPSGITDQTNLVLVSDAIPNNTHLNSAPSSFTDADGRVWTPVYSVASEPAAVAGQNLAADTIVWKDPSTVTDLKTVTRVGWVYDANSAKKEIDPGKTVTGFTFDVITDGLDARTGGTVANIAQVFGSTVNGPNVFDESGDQDASNFSGANPGPSETAPGSTGIANPAGHGVDSKNDNNATNTDPASPGGEDNTITIGAPGSLINGPDGQPSATGNIFNKGPNNNHDFQNLGIDNFKTASCTPATASGNPQDGKNCTLNPSPIAFNNTLSNPGTQDLKDVLLQPINPSFDSFGGVDANLPEGTKVTIKLGTQQAIYTYTKNGSNYSFVLDANTPTNPSQAIKIPTLAAGVPLDYTVTVDLPANTQLSTDLGYGYAVPIIAFVDSDSDGTPDPGENSNYTVNQVYTGFVKVTKEVKVLDAKGTLRPGMDYGDPDTAKKPLPGDTLVYRINYRNISEPQAGNGNNQVLNGVDVMIDENGTQANITGVTNGNNWGLDNNIDGDLDTINVQGTATDSNGGTITYFTGTSPATSTDKYSVDTLTSAGTTDPGVTVTGYRSTVKLLAPSADNSTFIFQRKVDQFDGLAQDPPSASTPGVPN